MLLFALAALAPAMQRGGGARADATRQPRCAELRLSAQPKSGTTWLAQLLYSLGTAACEDGRCKARKGATHMHLSGDHLDLRIEPKSDKHGVPGVGDEKFGYHSALFPKSPPDETLNAQRLDDLADKLRAEKTCIIFMFRDPRDVVVSGCHYTENWRHGEKCDLEGFWRKHVAATAEWISLRYSVFAYLEARGAPVSSVFFEDLKTNFTATATAIAAAAGLKVPARLLPRVQNETSLDALRDLAADGHLAGGETKVRKGEQCGFLSATNLTAEDISWASQFIDAMPRALRRKFACGDDAEVSARPTRPAFLAAGGRSQKYL